MSPPRAERAGRYRVVIYCPDRHIVYDGRTPDEIGVGGGITARVRMARALRRLGHQVTLVVNCARAGRFDRVEYVPLDGVKKLSGDVVLWTTSGDGLDLTPASSLDVQARLSIVWVHGPVQPAGFGGIGAQAIYAVSNFIGRIVRNEWGVPGERLFVVYNGHEESTIARAERLARVRDEHRLIYFSHPSKGLEAALGVLGRLRDEDPSFHLIVCGGPELWGDVRAAPVQADGVIDRGLVGQEGLAAELLASGISLHLQNREEPGSLAIGEAQRAGCIVVASPVGCFPEYIADGIDGFLIPGDPSEHEIQARAAHRIRQLLAAPGEMEKVRRQARAAAFDTDTLARVWTADWDRRLGQGKRTAESPCAACGGPAAVLPDGAHCGLCGFFSRAPLSLRGNA